MRAGTLADIFSDYNQNVPEGEFLDLPKVRIKKYMFQVRKKWKK